MDTDETISFSKSDPAIAKMFAGCKAGDDVSLTLEYEGQSVTLDVTVGGEDEQTFTGTINNVTAGEGGDDDAGADATPAAGGGEDEDETPPAPAPKGGSKKAMSPMDYIKSKRK